ncbi:MAG: tetratricopeptide repeat protein [Planctomyces sp.]|nr:tetratricopeptide repeat protein [Planctomyces sp.]
MRCTKLRELMCPLLLIAGSALFPGCQSMNGYVLNSSGQAYYEQGNYVAAANEFHKAAMAEPANPDYMANLARTRYKLGDQAGAEQVYRQALTIAPSHQPSYHGLAELMVAQRRTDEAGQMLTTWASMDQTSSEPYVELAWLQRELGQPEAAHQSLQRALQINPSDSTALAHMGQLFHDNGQPQQAVAMYQQSLQSDWNQPEVHSRMAAAAQGAGPGHPMSATAMARGVHPYEVPRQQTVFGPPSRGVQMAQMQMQQQMQFGGMTSGAPMMASGPPAMMAAGPPAMNTAFRPTTSPAPMMMPAPGQTTATNPLAGLTEADIAGQYLQDGWKVVPGSLRVVDSGSPGSMAGGSMAGANGGTSQTASGPVPQADPAFSQSNGTQATQISNSQPTPGVTVSTTQSEIPLIESF